MQTWDNGSKANLAQGEWSQEPDKGHWVDPTTGLDCLIVRGPMGALCGYVGVPPEHPWHGIEYGDPLPGVPPVVEDTGWDSRPTPDRVITVHGGLTFSGFCSPGEDESLGICHAPEPGRPDHVKWFGFDCSHLGDLMPQRSYRPDLIFGDRDSVYRDWAYVTQQVTKLAAQLAQPELLVDDSLAD